VNAAAALALLDTAPGPIADVGPEKKKVSQNIKEGVGIDAIESSSFSTHIAGLRPAERREFYFDVKKNTAAVQVTFSNLVPTLPPAEQNQLFSATISSLPFIQRRHPGTTTKWHRRSSTGTRRT
jgi:hypothetical protein